MAVNITLESTINCLGSELCNSYSITKNVSCHYNHYNYNMTHVVNVTVLLDHLQQS